MSLLGGGGGGLPIRGLQARAIGLGAPSMWFHTAPTAHNGIRQDASGGGSITQNSSHLALSTDATAGEHALLELPSMPNGPDAGQVLIACVFQTNQAIGNLAEIMEIGSVAFGSADSNDIACFRPHVGDNTQGNIRVDSGGADNDGSITYPDLTAGRNFFAILIDLDAGCTEFYVDKHPFAASTPTASIEAAPTTVRTPQAQIVSNQTDGNEELHVYGFGYTYVPPT